jgi:hypothetical protein
LVAVVAVALDLFEVTFVDFVCFDAVKVDFLENNFVHFVYFD